MKSKRRHLSAEFKARIAKEALKGEKSIAEIATTNEITPAQVTQWKKQAEERMLEIFEKTDKKLIREQKSRELREGRLERKVGQLVIEKEFLEKKCVELGIDLTEKP